MGNIIGEPFDPGVKRQIKYRERKLGESPKSHDILKWSNAKTSWLRLASSVDIDDELAKKFGVKSGEELAQKGVLYNGISSVNKDKDGNIQLDKMRSGILTLDGNSTNVINDNVYGFGGLEYGFRPMPGIIGADITSINRGSLRNATIQIKAFTPTQLDLIELLYMRVGFTVLLEWGHTSYIDNKNGQIINQNTFYTKPLNSLFDKNSKFDDILKSIREQRKQYSYNYDAFYGKIKSFNWTFNPDGTYDITVHVITIGDVIESLNIHRNKITEGFENLNIYYPPLSEEDEKNYEKGEYISDNPNTDILTFDEYVEKNAISENVSFYGVEYDKPSSDISIENLEELLNGENKINKVVKDNSSNLHKYFSDMKVLLSENLEDIEFTSLDQENFLAKGNTLEKAFVAINFKVPNENSPTGESNKTQYYIKLGAFLQYLNSNLLIYNKDLRDPIIKIDYDPSNNYCLTFPQQFPTNPSVCLIPINYESEKEKINGSSIKWSYLKDELGVDFWKDKDKTSKNPYIGNLMHIHVNMDFILDTYTTLYKNSIGNEVKLFDFLENTLTGITDSLGGVNSFTTTYNPDLNRIIIREDNNLRYDRFQTKDYTKFNVGGLRQRKNTSSDQPLINEGSIVKDVNFNVTISPQFSSMVSIGAQANANIVGEDATSLSKMYAGSKDRILTDKTDKYLSNIGNKTPDEEFRVNLELIETLLHTMYGSVKRVEGLAVSLSEVASPYFKYVKGYLSRIEQTPAGGFLPFDLNLKIEGISGIKNYQRFLITDEILPSTYRTKNGKSKVNFLIKGVTHTIKDNKWETSISTLTVPSEPDGKIKQRESLLPNNLKDICSAQKKTAGNGLPDEMVAIAKTSIRQNAMKTIYPLVFQKLAIPGKTTEKGELGGFCARYVYFMAKYFKDYIIKKSKDNLEDFKVKIDKLPDGSPKFKSGNANTKTFYSNLTRLGYRGQKVAQGIPRNEIKSVLDNLTPSPGDVFIYYGTTGNPQSGAVKYGHTQIFLGENGENSSLNGLPKSYWISSVFNNYGGRYIYSTEAEKFNVGCWDVWKLTFDVEGIINKEQKNLQEIALYKITKFNDWQQYKSINRLDKNLAPSENNISESPEYIKWSQEYDLKKIKEFKVTRDLINQINRNKRSKG